MTVIKAQPAGETAGGKSGQLADANLSVNSIARPMAVEKLLKAGDVAEILGVSKTQAYRLMGRELPCVKFGSTVRVRLSDLEAFIERSTQGGENYG